MGESFGAWEMGRDAELMDHVSSINVACGFHAGDPTVLRRTIETALAKGVCVGAHPSYPDLQGFGRREMKMPPDEIFDIVLYQVAAVRGVCAALGGRLSHVKPHGALYNHAARDRDSAAAIARAVKAIDPGLMLYGLSGSFLISEAKAIGLATASEVFADRNYQPDGSLTPRSEANALIRETASAISHVLTMLERGVVLATDGSEVEIAADTICIHGDGPNAVAFASEINRALRSRGFTIAGPAV